MARNRGHVESESESQRERARERDTPHAPGTKRGTEPDLNGCGAARG